MSIFIRTTAGDIAQNKLGWCQCHEHMFLKRGKPLELSKSLVMDDYDRSLEELRSYKKAGGVSLVDAQPVYSGRMAEELVSAAAESGVNIIASTGFHKHAFYYDDSPIFSMSEDELARLFIGEINDGMMAKDGSRLGAKAGIIKVAVDKGGIRATKAYERLFGAAVSAASETGASLLAHFEPDTDAFELIEKMEKAGISPKRLIACHLDRARIDAAYHAEVASAGAFLEYDTINRLKYVSNEAELDLIMNMLDKGFEDSLLLSLDTTNERLRAYGANMGLDYILTVFRQMLGDRGAGAAVVEKLMQDNAARAIAIRN